MLMMATIFPVAVWLVTGLGLLLFSGSLRKWRNALLIAWLTSAILLGDAPQSIIRGLVPDGRLSSTEIKKRVRVVSLNCLSRPEALGECMSQKPDVVLLQESPSRKSLQQIVTDFPGYSFVWSPDASMLVRGSLEPFVTPRQLAGEYVCVKVQLTNGVTFNAASLRLIPSPLRFDVWNRRAWLEFAQNRWKRRRQLTHILTAIDAQVERSEPVLIGGDFNAPARDAIFDLLKPELRDAFPEAGRGWGKTIVNSYPVQRIDQIWISSEFRAISVTAHKTLHSDHRMVICDLICN